MVLSPSDSSCGLTIVGVGPGDPELITVAAQRAIRSAQVVAYPVADLAREGMAARIAAPWLQPEQQRLPLLFPMVEAAAPRRQAWHAAADAVAACVLLGQAVVFLCEGDSSTYASASYLLLALQQRQPHCPVRMLPGITAAAAAAAEASSQGMPWPLALQQERLLIQPTPDGPELLRPLLLNCRSSGQPLVLLKLGRRWLWVRPLLEELGLLESAIYGERVGWPQQRLCPAGQVPAVECPYFSLLLLRFSWPEVLP